MPYPNFHAARIKSPDSFSKIVMLKKLSNGIQIYGGPLKSEPDSDTTAQTYRFPKDSFTVEEAKKWLKEHDLTTILFEPAVEKKDAEEVREVTQIDFAGYRIGKVKKTPEGYIYGTAPIAKVGILKYYQGDGSVINELVPEDTLFDQESMDSLKLRPITNQHPAEKIMDSKTVKRNKVGTVGENSTRIDDTLVTTLIVTDEDAITSIEKEGRKELSPGYTCELLMRPGVFNGMKYDAIQLSRRYNHLAICDKARGGSELRLNLDSVDNLDGFTVDKFDILDKSKNSFNRKEGTMPTFKIDGIEYQAAQEVVNFINKLQGDNATLSGSLKVKTDELDKKSAALDVASAKIVTLEKRDTAKEISDGVKERLSLLKIASVVMDQAEFSKIDDMLNKDVKIAIIKKKSPEANLDGKSDVYLDARFDGVVEGVKFDSSAIGSQFISGNFRQSGGEQVDIVEKARQDSEKAIKEGYKTLGGFAK